MKTTNGGASWTKDVNLYGKNISEIHFTDVNHGWACVNAGTMLIYYS